ncbi:bactofilin family protein [Desulfurobacterium sp.]
MFGKGDNKEKKSVKSYAGSEIKSILSKELKISGNIKSEGKVRIDGEIEGDIEGDYVILGSSAIVKGNVRADVLILQGTVKGNIHADSLELKSTASVTGEITVKNLTVEAGASVSGRVSSGNFYKETASFQAPKIIEDKGART